ncbi:MAG: FtsX-like permease family protein [Bacteroidetes bacterium]|nr:FtsX-like permease family protein [Bacteroidota bacterium]
MKLSLYIAKRYLFAKKSRNAINIISAVSVAGVMVGTMALVIILSVFNGLEKMVTGIFSTFDPDIRIEAARGKVFVPDSLLVVQLGETPGIDNHACILEENALLRYGEKQFIGTVRGVESHYPALTGLGGSMWDGEFLLSDQKGNEYAVVGLGVANNLGLRVNFVTPLAIYLPNRRGSISNPESAFNRHYIWPSGIFEVEQEFDSRYIFLPIGIVRDLLDYENEVSSIEVKLLPGFDMKQVTSRVKALFGSDYLVRDRFEQQELFYKVMKSEKLAIFIILTFIIIVASFNIIGSLTMLIIEKEKDIKILRSLGAGDRLIRRIFIYEGWMISVLGTLAGLTAGFLVCWVQQEFSIIRFQSESLILDAYPVVMKMQDFLLSGATVVAIGYAAAWYPVRYLNRKYLQKQEI